MPGAISWVVLTIAVRSAHTRGTGESSLVISWQRRTALLYDPFSTSAHPAQVLDNSSVSDCGFGMSDKATIMPYPGDITEQRAGDVWLKWANTHFLAGDAGYIYNGNDPPEIATMIKRDPVPESEATIVSTDAKGNETSKTDGSGLLKC